MRGCDYEVHILCRGDGEGMCVGHQATSVVEVRGYPTLAYDNDARRVAVRQEHRVALTSTIDESPPFASKVGAQRPTEVAGEVALTLRPLTRGIATTRLSS